MVGSKIFMIKASVMKIQWNGQPLYSGHPLGTKCCPLIRVAFIEGLFCQTVHLGLGFLAVIQRWPLFRGGR